MLGAADFACGWRLAKFAAPLRCNEQFASVWGAVNVIEMGENLKNQIEPQNIFEPPLQRRRSGIAATTAIVSLDGS